MFTLLACVAWLSPWGFQELDLGGCACEGERATYSLFGVSVDEAEPHEGRFFVVSHERNYGLAHARQVVPGAVLMVAPLAVGLATLSLPVAGVLERIPATRARRWSFGAGILYGAVAVLVFLLMSWHAATWTARSWSLLVPHWGFVLAALAAGGTTYAARRPGEERMPALPVTETSLRRP